MASRFTARVELALSRDMRRWAPLLAVLLTLPSVGSGLAVDDYFHRLRAQGADPFGHARWDMFNFVWDEADVARARQIGVFPWFTADGTRIAFFRPAASLTHLIDYNLWPNQAWLMHLESLCFYGLAVALVAALYRRILAPPWVAGLAAVLYAFDDAHALPVSFIANRNALMALCAGTGAIVAHDRWRRDDWRPGRWLALLSLLLGLLSAEAALGAVAYLLSYALWIDRAPWRDRLKALTPYLSMIAIWQVGYRALGYRVQGSGLYLDPVHEPRAFVTQAFVRGPALLLGQLATPPSDAWNVIPARWTLGFVLGACAFLGLVAWVVRPMWKRDATTRFFATGAVLAVAPVCATFPSDRLLFFIGIGAMAVVAQTIAAAFRDGEKTGRAWRYPAKILAGGWVAGHLVLSPLIKPVMSTAPRYAREYIEATGERVTVTADLPHQRMIIVNTPEALSSGYRWAIAGDYPRIMAESARPLSVSFDAVDVERVDANAVRVRVRGWYLCEMSARLFRGESAPLRLGDTVTMDDMTAEVTELTSKGRPRAVTFRFTGPVDAPRYKWIAWDGDRFVDFTPPGVGEHVIVGRDRRAMLMPDSE